MMKLRKKINKKRIQKKKLQLKKWWSNLKKKKEKMNNFGLKG